jgi:hypothetical protein
MQDARVLLLVTIGLVLMYLVWLGRGEPMLTPVEWRLGAGWTSIAALIAAAFLAIRGEWAIGAVLLAVSAALLLAARSRLAWPAAWRWRERLAERQPRGASSAPGGARSRSDLTLEEARAVLGVPAGASMAEIRAAYTRLMRLAHPDHGGTPGLAAQLNAARDRLLKR